MGNHWKVLDDRADADDQTAPFWQVKELYEDEWINHYGDYDPDDWHSALAYADRQARTISVELPRVGKETRIQGDYEGSFPMTVRTNWHGETVLDFPSYPGFALTADEQERLALTLLSLHHQRKDTQ